MARVGLSLVRDGLVTATVCDVIDEDQFVLLCDVYSPRSGNSTNNFDINTLSEDECHTKLWFFRKDRNKLHECLGIPEKSTLFKRKTVSSGLDCILLKPLCNPCRYTDIVPWFGRNPKELCLIFNAIVHLIYVNHNCRLWSCNQFFFQPIQLHRCRKCEPAGFSIKSRLWFYWWHHIQGWIQSSSSDLQKFFLNLTSQLFIAVHKVN